MLSTSPPVTVPESTPPATPDMETEPTPEVLEAAAPAPGPEEEGARPAVKPRQSTNVDGLEPCGGTLPPCEVKRRESGGNYTAVNPRGCGGHGCYGAWQFDPRTWAGLGYEGNPADAAPEIQDEAAARLWDGGRGCRHWSGPTWNGCQFKEKE